MNKEQASKYNYLEDKWNFIFKMRRKNWKNKANYTFRYYINKDRTKILEVSHAKEIVRTCPIYIDEIISCYFTCDNINIINLLLLIEVINNSFKRSCITCTHWNDNKCPYWEKWIKGNTIETVDGSIIFKGINSIYNLYELYNGRKCNHLHELGTFKEYVGKSDSQ